MISFSLQPMKVDVITGPLFQELEVALNDKSLEPQRFW